MNNIAKLDSFVIDIVSNNICVLLFKVHSITHQKIRIKNTFWKIVRSSVILLLPLFVIIWNGIQK
jgi:uncharacterized membrane protein YjjP (DUF1212 family)